jgi:CubicO group peptidase (beta-lactamase class C family)
MRSSQNSAFQISGHASPGFEAVYQEFERNFYERGEEGAACTIYRGGEKVVDLVGGFRCIETGRPWDDATLTLTFSVTKGMAAAAMVVAHSQGLFELDQPVASYWPEFAQRNKQRITVRQLLSHQAGLISTGRQLDIELLADHEALGNLLAAQPVHWQPGRKHGYHTLTLGWYQNELLRRVDPQGRSIGSYFQQEIAEPLGIEYYIGLPGSIAEDRLSKIQGFHRLELLGHLHELPPGMILSGLWPNSLVSKSVRCLKLENPAKVGDETHRHVEIPSANGFGQARAVAKVYEVLARGGTELGVTPQTWEELVRPAEPPAEGGRDLILKIDTRYGFGFSRPSGDMAFGSDHHAFGCPGAGGSFGMADPSQTLGFAYLTNRMGFRIFDDPREKAVREACYASLQRLPKGRSVA